MKPLELTGQRFGRLIVIERANKTTRGGRHWLCRCDCGKEIICIGSSLRNGNTQGCGCSRGLAVGEAAKNSVYSYYKRNAVNRNYKFSLTIEEFVNLTKQNCHYCGIEPQQVTLPTDCNGSYTYNGIDRVDNVLGYTQNNCVSCCKICNFAKRTLSYSEFLEWINRLIKFRGV